ncbi:MAG: hypothetical protein Q4G69_03500 [Planctomycetia bacterium]|nr:hypothetical protein [Planctomycetia bacterium]
MKLIGRVFVILIAIMSLVYLAFSVVLYASHKNWEKTAKSMEEKIKPAEAERDRLTAEKNDLLRTIEMEKDAYQKTVAALRTKARELTEENTSLLEKNSVLESDIRKRMEVLTANNTLINQFQVTVSTLSNDLAAAQKNRADYLRDLAVQIGEMHEKAAQIGDIQKKNQELKQDYEKAKIVLDMKDLEPVPELYNRTPPFDLQGVIKAVKEGPRKLVLINLGSDDGLKPQHTLEVSRGAVYLGKIEVVKAEPHQAACEILSQYQQGEIKEGDLVRSKYKQ